MRFRHLLLVLALSFLGLLVTREDPLRSLRQPRCDFLAFYWAGRGVIDGYPPHKGQAQGIAKSWTREHPDWGGKKAFIPAWLYPPTSAVLLSPWMIFDERTATYVWYASISASLVGILYLSLRLTRWQWTPWLLGAWLLPVFLAIIRGSCPEAMNTLAVFSAAYLLLEWRSPFLAGVCLAIPCLVKPGVELSWFWPLVVVWAVDATGRSRAALLAGGTICAAVVIGTTLYLWGTEPWFAWVDQWKYINHRYDTYARCYTLSSALWVTMAIRWWRMSPERTG